MSRSLYSMLHSRFGPTLSASERWARIQEKLRFERPNWQPPELSATCLNQLTSILVAVVGGGFAGLLAARNLSRKNVNITIFEASPFLGGRVRSNTTFSNGRITEAGAELIGSMHVMWRELAIEYGLAWISRMDGDLYAREGLEMKVRLDKLLSHKELQQLAEDMRKILAEISSDAKRVNDPFQPWLQKDIEPFDKISVGDKLEKLGIEKTDRRWKAMELFLTNNNVAPLEELNYLGLLCLVKGGNLGPDKKGMMGYWDELEIFRCADGCQMLATKMAYEIRTKGKIELNADVTEIDVNNSVALKWKKKHDNEKVEERAGDFDFVILAIPPSVWRRVKITPEHPKDKIGEMGMGAAAKFFSDVKERFWIKDKSAPFGGSLKMGQVWEGIDNQTRVGDQGIVLSAFSGSNIPTETQYRQGLKELYPKYDDNLKNTLLVDWSHPIKERFIQTGYAVPRKGQIFRIGKKLIEPVQKRMFLAGEHTQMDFFGYMEGALRSGARAANDLMRQACSLAKTKVPVPRPPSPSGRIASAQPVRERTAFEREIATLLELAAMREPERDVTPPSTADLQNRVDEYFDYVNTEYTLPDRSKVKARPHFRISGGFSGPKVCHKPGFDKNKVAGCIKSVITQAVRAHNPKLVTDWLRLAIHRAVYGRGSAEGIRRITQALLDAGKLDEVKKKYSSTTGVDAVRMLQSEFGYGMNCAGYVQRAFFFVWESTKEDSDALRRKYGFRALGSENLYDLASNKKFRKMKYEDAAPGDLLILNAPQGDDAGHTVLVRGRTPTAGPKSNVHMIEVDASWGAGPQGLLSGGVQRRSFAYNADTKEWGDVQAVGSVKWNAIGPYNNHPVQGLYRPKN